MNKDQITAVWDSLRQRHGIALRLVELFPEDGITKSPIPGMRTPAQQIAHMYLLVKDCAEGVVSGTISPSSEEAGYDAGIKSKADMIAFMNDCWAKGSAAVSQATDAQVAAKVNNPWGMEVPGWLAVMIIYDEFMHHRGQMYAWARVFGKEPPMLWDFGNNAPEFRPQAAQTS